MKFRNLGMPLSVNPSRTPLPASLKARHGWSLLEFELAIQALNASRKAVLWIRVIRQRPLRDLAKAAPKVNDFDRGEKQAGRRTSHLLQDDRLMRIHLCFVCAQPCTLCDFCHDPYAGCLMDKTACLMHKTERSIRGLTPTSTLYRYQPKHIQQEHDSIKTALQMGPSRTCCIRSLSLKRLKNSSAFQSFARTRAPSCWLRSEAYPQATLSRSPALAQLSFGPKHRIEIDRPVRTLADFAIVAWPWTNKASMLKIDISDVQNLHSSNKAHRPKIRDGLYEGIRKSISSTKIPSSTQQQTHQSKAETHYIQDADQEHRRHHCGLLGRQRHCWPIANSKRETDSFPRANKIDAASINHMAHEALSRAGGDEKPTDEQIRELINKVTGAATATATAKRQNNANQWAWDNPYWNRYSWSYNGLTANYYCYTGGSYCYYAQWNRSYNGYLWWGYYNAYSWPVNYSRNWKTWNYWGW
ncbi:uncharacterized protein MYCFIDRAFT_172864 [Pseudocercospora fijiensis CIRAD86]|uniref:Uncharacterized protein n=1 Tax=Pseudocercospora fijiensis (strain CIRAD86) TaxID=383855 RepID=M3AGW2_PSEFD|nr:uncharacterized protein MYCFIDRAFT_172864 [Pseudocercospora fijiensis CIRAD86]EME83786.1 hypothetical protein MYCFIDRAFT_172864 [Pseudocercospora fijiensis CIRAD86]